MSGTLLSFCLMAIGVRELSGHINTFQILLFRSIIGLAIISLIIASTRNYSCFRSQRIGLHSFRNIFHFGGQYGWFVGISLLPLAEVFALEFTVPIWTLIIACLFLNESLTLPKVLAITLGILGVLVITQPGKALFNPAALIVLAAAICYAVAHSTTKALATTESTHTIIFMMCLMQLPIGLAFSVSVWVAPAGIDWLWLGLIGVTAITAHYCMTTAMRYADVSIVVTLDFLRLPIIAAVGVVVYAERFEISLIIGALMMLLGNIINVYTPSPKTK